jgi:hypothetical protein
VSGETDKSSIPHGYSIPHSLLMPIKNGGLGSFLQASSSASGNLSKGINIVGTVDGIGELEEASLSLVTSLIGSLDGVGTIAGSMVGSVSLSGSADGEGDAIGQLGLIAWLVGDSDGQGNMTGVFKGVLSMSGDCFVNSGTATVNELIDGVWNAQMSEYTNSGTTGERLNDAGGSGTPPTVEEIRIEMDTNSKKLKSILGEVI